MSRQKAHSTDSAPTAELKAGKGLVSRQRAHSTDSAPTAELKPPFSFMRRAKSKECSRDGGALSQCIREEGSGEVRGQKETPEERNRSNGGARSVPVPTRSNADGAGGETRPSGSPTINPLRLAAVERSPAPCHSGELTPGSGRRLAAGEKSKPFWETSTERIHFADDGSPTAHNGLTRISERPKTGGRTAATAKPHISIRSSRNSWNSKRRKSARDSKNAEQTGHTPRASLPDPQPSHHVAPTAEEDFFGDNGSGSRCPPPTADFSPTYTRNYAGLSKDMTQRACSYATTGRAASHSTAQFDPIPESSRRKRAHSRRQQGHSRSARAFALPISPPSSILRAASATLFSRRNHQKDSYS